jgi:hypothetical protein
MAIRVITGALQNITKEQTEKIENKLLQAVVGELGPEHALLEPDWTKITFSRVGPSHPPPQTPVEK